MITRTIQCAICGKQETEQHHGAGWPGWGGMKGVILNNVAEPDLCPDCLKKVMDFIDNSAGVNNDVD